MTLSDTTIANPTFVAPTVDEDVNLIFELVVTNRQGLASEPDSVTITVNPSSNSNSPFEGILGSGNNINIQVQENSGNNGVEQSGNENRYSDSPILQEQSTQQNSQVIS